MYSLDSVLFQSPCGVLGVCRHLKDLIAAKGETEEGFSPLAGF